MDFQPEIIRLILSHLDSVDDLKKCLLTSEEVREIIIKTPELMRRLTVILLHVTWKEKLSFVEKYGFFIRALKLDDIGFESNEEYMRILRQTPNLERLIVDDCYIASERETDNDNDDAEPENNANNAENEGNEPEGDAADGEPANNVDVEMNQEAIVENMEVEVQQQQQQQQVPEEGEENMEVQENANEAQAVNVSRDNSPNDHNNNDNPRVNENVEQNAEIAPNNQEGEGEIAAAAQAADEAAPSPPPNIDKTETEIQTLRLKQLSHLHLESSTISEAIVKSLPDCTTLKFLKLTFYYQEPVNTFTELFCQQDGLESLELHGWSDMVFKCLFKDDLRERIKFRLKKFSLECELSYHANFSNFLRSQAEHIRELELSCYNINFHYYRMIFNNFTNLVSLNIPVDWFLTDARLNLIKDCRLYSLRELELIGSNEDVVSFTTIMNIFPNIEVLKCENLQNFSLFGILEPFKRLNTIRTENFRCETLLFVKLPALRNLETGFLYPFAMDFLWKSLAEDCPNLEKIVIEEIGHFKLNVSVKAEFAIILKNLKYFKSLKVCKITCSPSENTVNGDHDGPEHEPPPEHAFFKVDIRVDDRTIKISQHFAQHCAEEVQILRETYKDCDITEE